MSSNNRIDHVPLAAAQENDTSVGQLFACGFSSVGPDPVQALRSVAGTTMVCLLTAEEIVMRYPDYIQWLNQHRPSKQTSNQVPSNSGQTKPHAIWLQISDGEITDDEDVVDVVSQVVGRLQGGHNVVVHCGAGMARTAVVCILTMVALGAELADASVEFRQARPGGGPDGPAQEKQIARLAGRFT